MPIPEIGPGELLVHVKASGVCGSDVMEWYRVHKAPLILGHEIAGEIAAVGKGLEPYYKKGDRISAAHHVPCNTCHYCRKGHPTVCETLRRTHFDPGGFSEYVRLLPLLVDRGVFRLPEEVSFEEATFIEPLACVLRGQRLARVQPGQCVLIIGSGIAGLLHIQLARAREAGRIVATDICDFRLDAARRFGADEALHAKEDVPERLREQNEGRLADTVILCTGSLTAILQGLQSVDRGGTVLFFAPTNPGVTLSLSVNDLFWRNEITLTSSYASDPKDFRAALELIRTRSVRVREMITHRLGLAEAEQGFRLVAEATESLKVIIDPQR